MMEHSGHQKDVLKYPVTISVSAFFKNLSLDVLLIDINPKIPFGRVKSLNSLSVLK